MSSKKNKVSEVPSVGVFELENAFHDSIVDCNMSPSDIVAHQDEIKAGLIRAFDKYIRVMQKRAARLQPLDKTLERMDPNVKLLELKENRADVSKVFADILQALKDVPKSDLQSYHYPLSDLLDYLKEGDWKVEELRGILGELCDERE